VSICRSRTRAGPISKGSHAHSLGLKMISRVAEGLKRPEHDVDAGLDVGIVVAKLADRRLGAQQCDAASGHDAFLDGRLGCVPRVVDAALLLLGLDLGRAADADDRHAAGRRERQVRMIVRRNAA
jgi:hypothetical protein